MDYSAGGKTSGCSGKQQWLFYVRDSSLLGPLGIVNLEMITMYL